MSKFNTIISAMAISMVCLVSTSCERLPGVAETTAEPSVAEAPATQPVPAQPSFQIFAAQIGNALNEQGQLKESVTELSLTDPIYGVAVFRGTGPAESKVSVKVADAQGVEVFTEDKIFTPGGDTSIIFNIRAADASQWKTGGYKATYVCDGAPCWEVAFKIN